MKSSREGTKSNTVLLLAWSLLSASAPGEPSTLVDATAEWFDNCEIVGLFEDDQDLAIYPDLGFAAARILGPGVRASSIAAGGIGYLNMSAFTSAALPCEELARSYAGADFWDDSAIIDHPDFTGQPGTFTAFLGVTQYHNAIGENAYTRIDLLISLGDFEYCYAGTYNEVQGFNEPFGTIGDGFIVFEDIPFVYGEPIRYAAGMEMTADVERLTIGGSRFDLSFASVAGGIRWLGMDDLPEGTTVEGAHDWTMPAGGTGAQALIWSGAVDANPFLADNWEPMAVPSTLDTATIGSGGVVRADALNSGGTRLEALLLSIFDGELSIEAASLAIGGSLQVRGTATASGRLTIEAGGTVESGMGLVGAGIDGSRGEVILRGAPGAPGQWLVDGGLAVGRDAMGASEGTIILENPDTRVEVTGVLTVREGGSIVGNGTLAATDRVVLEGGLIAPGLSPGTLTVEGDLEQLDGSTTLIEIGGDAPSARDQLVVTGSAHLNGKLILRFVNGFAPHAGNSFSFLSAGQLDGAFTATVVEGLQPGFQFDVDIADGAGVISALNDGVALAPLPSPAITHTGSAIRINWPEGFRLQSSLNLLPDSWKDRDTGGASSLTLSFPLSIPTEFFRLARELPD